MDLPVQVIGHRGARGLFPENTIDGFIRSVKLGVYTLELDVVISKDDKVVVSHEPWMHYRFCTEPDGQRVKMRSQHNIYQMNYEDVKRFDCGQRINPEFPRQAPFPAYKPLLGEVIDEVERFTIENHLPPVEYIIEIKSNERTDGLFHPSPEQFATLVWNEIASFGIAERIVIKSFDVRPMQELKLLGASARLGLLVANTGSVKRNIQKLGFVPYTYNPSYALARPKVIEEARAMGMKVMVWTVNDAEFITRMIDSGVDGIITDYPDLALEILRSR